MGIGKSSVMSTAPSLCTTCSARSKGRGSKHCSTSSKPIRYVEEEEGEVWGRGCFDARTHLKKCVGAGLQVFDEEVGYCQVRHE